MQVNMAEEAGRARSRRSGRLIITTALLVIGALVVVILAGMSLTPRSNAMIALVVFGGMLGAVLLVQRLVGPRDATVVEDIANGDDTER